MHLSIPSNYSVGGASVDPARVGGAAVVDAAAAGAVGWAWQCSVCWQ